MSLRSPMQRLQPSNFAARAVTKPSIHVSLLWSYRFHFSRQTRVVRSHLGGAYSSGAFVTSETISPEMVTIEILPAEDEHSTTSPHPQNAEYGSSANPDRTPSYTYANSQCSEGNSNDPILRRSASASTTTTTTTATTTAGGRAALHQKPYWDVTSIDNFAKSRVLNYIRRTAGKPSADVFEVHGEEMFGSTVYRARCRLVLPPPHHLYVAEGVAEEEKDAELLAAMHAERVCDALGVPLFRLPSMQQKHAEAARRQGRYAPMPGDPIGPENTPIPPPLRMVRAASQAEGERADSVFATTIQEAEIVQERHARDRRTHLHAIHNPAKETAAHGCTNSSADHGMAPQTIGNGASAERAAPLSTSSSGEVHSAEARRTDLDDTTSAEWVRMYHTTVYYPWQAVSISPLSSPTAANTFDPTENGIWQMVNTTSTRCSPSPDALLLPCVYDPPALERMKDHFLQHGLSLRDRLTMSHVAVPGHSARMFVAEMRLTDAIVARGKAQTRDVAEHLAAMHAELLLGALAKPLFPQDAARQARHAMAAAQFGRWAPTHTDAPHPNPHNALPLPLKQQVGGDEVWLDPQLMRRLGHQRSVGERLIAAHNEVNTFCGDYIEANPDLELLAEARRALLAWQRDVARNPFPDLFVITRMGDQFRASTVLPVPREYGIRGGNAVGKTMEQAMDLCALHAIDVLCALGIPVYASAERQERFLAERRAAGLMTAEDMRGLRRGKGLVAIVAPSQRPSEGGKGKEDGDVGGKEKGLKLYEEAEVEDDVGKWRRPAYLPGYMVEGNQPRPVPHAHDTIRILQLRIPEDFTVWGEDLSDEALVEAGNEAKVCVQNYLRFHLPKNANVNASVYITGYGRQVSVHNIAYLPLVRPRQKASTTTTKPPTEKDGTKKQKKNRNKNDTEANPEEVPKDPVEEKEEVRVTPSVNEKGEERLVAIGISLKKKDAERACYLHAVDILRNIGQDVLTNYRAGLPRRKMVPTNPKQQQQQQQGTQEAVKTSPEADAPEVLEKGIPKPYMHKLMMKFLTSGKHYTQPKRRTQPGPYSPF